jgi:gentisate 1,2-dioxygenase
VTQAAACPAAQHAEKTGTTTSQRDGTCMRYSSIYAKPAYARGRTTSPVFNFNYVYSQNRLLNYLFDECKKKVVFLVAT